MPYLDAPELTHSDPEIPLPYRIGGLLTLLAIIFFVATPAHAGRKARKKRKKKPAAPVTVELTNGCKAKAKFKLGNVEAELEGGATGAPLAIQGGAFENTDNVYDLRLGDKSLGLYTLVAGGKYAMRVTNCRAEHADVLTTHDAERPKGTSPNAAAKVRFRARQNTFLEYRSGKRGRFKPLSVAMTRYQEIPGGDHMFTFRLRAAKRGPVLKMYKGEVKVDAGHAYLIEANVVGKEILFKAEDEGWGGEDGK